MSSNDGFRPDIEGLRAVAILLVLLYHAQVPWVPGGFIGVDVFFVLSGFLITRSLVAEAEASGSVRLGEFYARRVRRLLPASALVLVATAVATWWALPSTMWRAFGGDITAAAAYVVNWRLALRSVDYLAQDVLPSPVQHFWSLSVEEQFYFIWPALILLGLVLTRWTRRPMRQVLGLLLVVVVVIPSFSWGVLASATEPASAFFVTTTRLWEMAVGALVAIGGSALALQPGLLRLVLKVSALLALGATAVLVDGSVPWPGVTAAVPILATAILISAGGVDQRDVVERFLSTVPMQRVGGWSYSLYLWHWPPLAILGARWGGLTTDQAVVITLASFVPAVMAYRWVESPLRIRKSLRASPALTLSLGSTLTLASVVAGLGLALAVTSSQPPTNAGPGVGPAPVSIPPDITPEEVLASLAEVASFVPSAESALADLPTTYAEGCHVKQTDPEPVVCERGDPDGSVRVAMVGDSKVAQWEPAIDLIGRRRGWRVFNVTKSACELSLEMPNLVDVPYPSCLEWSRSVIDLIEELQVDVVVVSQVSSSAWASAENPMDRQLLLEGMAAAYRAVERAGARVVVMMDNPHPPIVVRDCVAGSLGDLAACAFDRAPREDSGGRVPLRTVAEEVGLPMIDMADWLCPAGVCAPVIGNFLVYRNGSHITATYVRALTDVIEERLLPHVEPVPLGAGAAASVVTAEEVLDHLEATVAFRPTPEDAPNDRPSLYDEGCQVDQRSPDVVVCERGATSGALYRVFAVGDSKIAQWEPALDAIGRRRGWSVANITKSACELTLAMPNQSGSAYPSCLEWSGRVIEMIEADPPDVVILSQGSGTAWGGTGDPQSRPIAIAGMISAYERIQRAGSTVVVLLDNPRPPFMVTDCVAEHRSSLAMCAFEPEELEDYESRSTQVEVAETLGVPIVDMIDLICPAEVCAPVIGGILVYRDRTHITASYIRSMAPFLEERLVAVVEQG